MKIKNYITLVFCTALTINVLGQGLQKEVHVTSNYRPELEKFEKINMLPELDDTVAVQPAVDVSIIPSRIETTFDVKEIKPAKIVANPLDKLYNSFIRVGGGNYLSPLLEFNIHNLRSKDYVYGGYAYHKSASPKLELENGDKVSAKSGKTQFGAYGKMFFDEVTLDGDLQFNARRINRYGYNTLLHADTFPNIPDWDKQVYNEFNLTTKLHDNSTDSLDFHYGLQMDGYYYYDTEVNRNRETMGHIGGTASQMFKGFKIGANVDFNYYQKKLKDRKPDNAVWKINPYVQKKKHEWEFSIGMNLVNDRDTNSRWHFYPDAYLKFFVIQDIIQAYFGVTGNLEVNSFKKITTENPYLTPGYGIWNTNHQLIGYIGLNGRLGKNGGYRIDARFDAMDDMYYYVVDHTYDADLQNTFWHKVDDTDVIRFSSEVFYTPLSNLSFFLKGQVDKYQMVDLEKPWHRPSFNGSFTTRYNYQEKVFGTVEILNVGKRYAPAIPNLASSEMTTLDPIWDVNLLLEYKYSKVLTAFVDFHNILGNHYMLWSQYPSQGFNMMLGITYKL